MINGNYFISTQSKIYIYTKVIKELHFSKRGWFVIKLYIFANGSEDLFMAVLIDQPPIICKPPEIGQAPQKKIIIKRKKERKRTEGEVINFVCDLSACQDSAWN